MIIPIVARLTKMQWVGVFIIFAFNYCRTARTMNPLLLLTDIVVVFRLERKYNMSFLCVQIGWTMKA